MFTDYEKITIVREYLQSAYGGLGSAYTLHNGVVENRYREYGKYMSVEEFYNEFRDEIESWMEERDKRQYRY